MANVPLPTWQRHDWQRFVRHDAHRFVKPEPIQRKAHAERLVEQQRAQEEEAFAAAEQEALRESLLSIRRELAELKFELAFRRIFHKYRADQLRVPKGNPGGGQWAKEGGGDAGKDPGSRNDPSLISKPAAMRRGGREPPRQPGKIPRSVAEWLVPRVETPEQERARADRLADDAIRRVREVDPTWEPRPSLYERSVDGDIRKAKDLVLEAESRLVELGRQSHQKLIQIYRAQHNSIDLFDNPTWPFENDTVAVTIFDGVPIFGTNSTIARLRTGQDDSAADVAREMAIVQYPELRRENLGWKPMDGFYHAEPTVMFRAARANGGSLEGRTLEIHVDREMCRTSCPIVLPIIGLQLGNPNVTFVDEAGRRRTMKDGGWK